MITRRLFSFGLLTAPVIIRTHGLLMPIKDQRWMTMPITIQAVAVDASWIAKDSSEWLQMRIRQELYALISGQPIRYTPDGWTRVKETVLAVV